MYKTRLGRTPLIVLCSVDSTDADSQSELLRAGDVVNVTEPCKYAGCTVAVHSVTSKTCRLVLQDGVVSGNLDLQHVSVLRPVKFKCTASTEHAASSLKKFKKVEICIQTATNFCDTCVVGLRNHAGLVHSTHVLSLDEMSVGITRQLQQAQQFGEELIPQLINQMGSDQCAAFDLRLSESGNDFYKTNSSDMSQFVRILNQHGIPSAAPAEDNTAVHNSTAVPSSIPLPRREACPFYVKTGKCKFGKKCKFDHPPRQSEVGQIPVPRQSPSAGHIPERAAAGTVVIARVISEILKKQPGKKAPYSICCSLLYEVPGMKKIVQALPDSLTQTIRHGKIHGIIMSQAVQGKCGTETLQFTESGPTVDQSSNAIAFLKQVLSKHKELAPHSLAGHLSQSPSTAAHIKQSTGTLEKFLQSQPQHFQLKGGKWQTVHCSARAENSTKPASARKKKKVPQPAPKIPNQTTQCPEASEDIKKFCKRLIEVVQKLHKSTSSGNILGFLHEEHTQSLWLRSWSAVAAGA